MSKLTSTPLDLAFSEELPSLLLTEDGPTFGPEYCSEKKKNESYTKVKDVIDPSVPTILPEFIPVSVAWSDGWDASPSRTTSAWLFARTHLLSWLEREDCEAKVPCPRKQLNDSVRSRTQTSWAGPSALAAGHRASRVMNKRSRKMQSVF